MDYNFQYSSNAQKDLAKLDPNVSHIILKKLDYFLKSENPFHFAKKLKNTVDNHWRFRIGDYRAIFAIDKATGDLVILIILKIAHRKEIYKA